MEAIIMLRFSTKEFTQQLVDEGTIYMNTVDFFSRVDDYNGRHDKLEGVSWIMKPPMVEFYKDDQLLAFSKDSTLLTRNEQDNGNLYCLYTITEDEIVHGKITPIEVGSQMLMHDEYVAVIYNPKQFLSQILSALQEKGIRNYKYHAVRYENVDSYSGRWGVFTKPDSFRFQKEFRLFIPSDGNAPISFSIGSIKDISIMIHKEELGSVAFEFERFAHMV